ncbi:hypothetical protein EDD15DRAFT_2256655, partial [Pisolithus albus]
MWNSAITATATLSLGSYTNTSVVSCALCATKCIRHQEARSNETGDSVITSWFPTIPVGYLNRVVIVFGADFKMTSASLVVGDYVDPSV